MLSMQTVCSVFLALIEFSYCASNEFYVVSSTTQLPESAQNEDFKDLKSKIVSLIERLDATEVQRQRTEKQWHDCERNSNLSKSFPRSCEEVLERGHRASGIYKIKPHYAAEEFSVLCNMRSQGGGWTYILNRYDGSQDFYKNWKEYKHGFGDLNGEFWLGLKNIHLLTGYEINQLLIELVDWEGKKVHAHYDLFTIGSEKEGYPLKYLQGYSGDAGDSLTHELGMKFTTKDRDQDVWVEDSCGTFSQAGWWYRDCKYGHLTGVYLGEHFDQKKKLTGIYWVTFHGNTYSLKEVRMMVKPYKPVNTNPALDG